jgi:hypothetical protein
MSPRFDFLSFDSYWLLHPPEIREQIAPPQKARARNFKRLRKRPLEKSPKPSLDEIREKLQEEFQQVITGNVLQKGHCHVYQHPTGAGKNYALIQAIVSAAQSSQLVQRVLFLTKDIDMARKTETQFQGIAVYQEGRNPDNCRAFSVYHTIARKRFDASDTICRPCEHRGDCPYLQQRSAALDSNVVVAVYQSFINESRMLNDFDLIVIDENLMDAGIFEEILFSEKDLERMMKAVSRKNDYYPPSHTIHIFLHGLKQLIAHGKTLGEYSSIPVNEVIRQFIPLSWTVLSAQEAGNGSPPQTYKLEQRLRGINQSEEMPTRVLADMLPALYHIRGRAILSREGIRFCRLRNGVEILLNKRVINLDATPSVAMLDQLFGEQQVHLHGERMPAPNCTITQVLGQTYIARALKNPANEQQRTQLLEMGLHCAKGFQKPLFVGHKFLFEAPYHWDERIRTIHPGAEIAWFGGSTRGSNQYKACDCIVILGHYQIPVETLMLRLNTIRRESSPEWREPSLALQPIWKVGNSELIPAHLQKTHPDKLLQRVLDEQTTAEVVQIIGRARPMEKDTPVQVFLIDGWAYYGLPIDHVISREELLAKATPEMILKRGKNLESLNKQRQEDAVRRYQSFMEQNPGASAREASSALKMSRNTIAKIQKEAADANNGLAHTE